MRLLNLFRRQGSASVARDRLQILLSHERSAHGHSDLLGILREEILAAVGRHITVDQDNVAIRMGRGTTLSTLEIEIVISHSGSTLFSGVARA
jgi:cell division topological specificity factor